MKPELSVTVDETNVSIRADYIAELRLALGAREDVRLLDTATVDGRRKRDSVVDVIALVLTTNAAYGLFVFLKAFARSRGTGVEVSLPDGTSSRIDADSSDDRVSELAVHLSGLRRDDQSGGA